jgi:hypothetical protein
MKRLRKCNKWYNNVELTDPYSKGLFKKKKPIDIFKDPTGAELTSIMSTNNGVKMFVTKQGIVYAWDGSYLHDVMLPMINVDAPVTLTYWNNALDIYIKQGVSNANELCDIMNKAKSIFNRTAINEDTIINDVDVNYYGGISDKSYSYFQTLKQIYDYNKNGGTPESVKDLGFGMDDWVIT